MHRVLEAARENLDLDLPSLTEAARRSEGWLGEMGRYLGDVLPTELDLDVMVLGSIARHEATPQSDLDFLVVTHGLLDPPDVVNDVLAATEQVREQLSLRKPGATRTFGRVVAAPELVHVIGLEDDTNRNHTHRILALTESASVFREDLHSELVHDIVARYLADYEEPKRGVPRFLLNDVLRYWRTLAVDYQAKKWGVVEPEWGLRYLKLIISRKLAIAGTLMCLFLCKEATVEYFEEQFAMPALARLTQIHDHVDGPPREALRTALQMADQFNADLADEDFRSMAKNIRSRSQAYEHEEFTAALDDARRLQNALETIFFDAEPLRETSRKYLSF